MGSAQDNFGESISASMQRSREEATFPTQAFIDEYCKIERFVVLDNRWPWHKRFAHFEGFINDKKLRLEILKRMHEQCMKNIRIGESVDDLIREFAVGFPDNF